MNTPQQTTYTCNQRAEFYKHLREIKDRPFKDKMESTFQISGILWGNLNIVLAAVLLGAIFHKYVFDFIKKNTDIQISFKRKGK